MTPRTSLIEASPGDQSPTDPRFVEAAPPVSRQHEPPHTPRQVTAVVAVLSLAVLMASLERFIVNLAFPYIAREYRGTRLSSLSPGQLMVLPFARLVAPHLAAMLGGVGRVAVVGCALNPAAQAPWLTRITGHPAYLTHLLPAQLIGGAGVGLTIPSEIGAGSALVTAARFGTRSGILNRGRQVGTVLATAVKPTPLVQ